MRLAAWTISATALALVIVELAMQPDGRDRALLAALFGGTAALSLFLAWAARRVTDRAPTVRRAMLWPTLAAISVVAAVVIVAAELMFISSHDRNVTLAALGLGTALAMGLYLHLSARLQSDLTALHRAAAAVSRGDRKATTGIERFDELGTAAAAFDDMVERIGHSETSQRRLFASLGHDLRTPLTALRLAVEALQDGVARDEARYLEAMSADIDALSCLVGDLLVLARVDSGHYEPNRALVDLADIAADAVAAVAPVALDRGITVSIDASGNTVVEAGRNDLGRAVRNLLDNALRYSPDRSRVTVVISNGGPQATLQVVDEGPGFHATLGDSAFDEFITTDQARRRDGTRFGLGLAIVRSVVRAHGGSTWIEPGPGGRVTMGLPVAPGPALRRPLSPTGS